MVGAASAKPKHMIGLEKLQEVADKEVQKSKRRCTKMCSSVEKNTKCPHGDKCRFAHSVEELQRDDCFFGDKCKMVKCVKGVWVNKPGIKKCLHLHPKETVENMKIREKATLLTQSQARVAAWVPPPACAKPTIGIVVPAKPLVAELQQKIDAGEALKQGGIKEAISGQSIGGRMQNDTRGLGAGYNWTKPKPQEQKFVSTGILESPSTPETVLRVPRELAAMAMKLAIDSGKKNIRVEIIGESEPTQTTKKGGRAKKGEYRKQDR